MKLKTLLLSLLMASVALAGCTSNDEPTSPGDEPDIKNPDDVKLKEGKGALQGIVVDDRFRPVPGALVLIQELAATQETTENGEFQFIDLNPGQYTIRVEKEGHEGVPASVTVAEGEFAEVTAFANRISNEEGTVLTREFSVFVPCAAAFVVNGVTMNCVLDLSGDSWRSSFTSNFTEVEDITYMVTEAKINQEGNWNVQVREDDGSSAGGERYAVADIFDGDYVKIVNKLGEVNEEHNGQNNNVAWMNDRDFSVNLFLNGDYKQDIQDVGNQVCNPSAPPTCRSYTGVAAAVGIRATFVQSIFIGEPEIDIDSYNTMS